MGKRRVGGIVTAVTLTIAVAFAVIILLFLNQSVRVAVSTAESATELFSSELSTEISSFMNEQDALVASELLNDELVDALEREAAGADPKEVARQVTPVLARLVVDDKASRAYLASSASHVVYLSDGTWKIPSSSTEDAAWVALAEHEQRDDVAAYFVHTVPGREGNAGTVLSGHRIVGRGAMGVAGVSVRTTSLSQVMETLSEAQDVEAACFTEDGTVIVSTASGAVTGTNVFVEIPQIEELASLLERDPSMRLRLWTGTDGLYPHGQMLYEIRYCVEFGAYLLTMNSAQAIFDDMRMGTSTLVLALTVVMILMLLLVMTSVRGYRRRLIRVATTDELTGLANRKSFVESYERFVAEVEEPATLALVDVDRFKQINDTYGHAAGDKALAAVAREVRAMAASDGLAGRWGGDEFIGVVRLPLDEATERIRETIGRVAALTFDEGFTVSVSIGATALDREKPLERMVEQADDALYVTKEGGRGFLSVYTPGVTPHASELAEAATRGAATKAVATEEKPKAAPVGEKPEMTVRLAHTVELVVHSLLEAVRKMVPFVAGGGILIAVAFLIDGASVDMNALSSEARANFGSITPIAAGLRDVGSAAFNFMLPIFAAFLARGIAGDAAFMAGFAGGFLASQGSAGFMGAICAAFVSAAVVRMMCGFVEETATGVQRVAPVLLYPVFSLLIMYLLMEFVIDPVATAFDGWLTSMLVSLEPCGRVVLGLVCGAMMATDMGGPINKAAYHFGVAAIAAGSPDIMAAVMVGGMVPPCGIALCMLLFRNRFTEVERDQGAATLFMGLAFITEGAIPFVLTDIARVIPACMVGSGIAGALSMACGCTLMAPHGGIFVLPVVGGAGMYVVALALGSLVTAVILGVLKQPAEG